MYNQPMQHVPDVTLHEKHRKKQKGIMDIRASHVALLSCEMKKFPYLTTKSHSNCFIKLNS